MSFLSKKENFYITRQPENFIDYEKNNKISLQINFFKIKNKKMIRSDLGRLGQIHLPPDQGGCVKYSFIFKF